MSYPHADEPFHVPHSPLSKEQGTPSSSKVGQRLFDTTSEFYAWYLSWDINPSDHRESFKILSQIMRIAQVSLSKGHFLQEEEETLALTRFNGLKERLFDGNIKSKEIVHRLTDILLLLTRSNPKSRLVAQATELEYLFCLYPKEPLSEEQLAQMEKLLHKILSAVTPELMDIHAHAIAQGLAKLIEKPSSHANPLRAVEEAIGNWI